MKGTIAVRVIVAIAFLLLFIAMWVRDGLPDLDILKLSSGAMLLCVVAYSLWDFWLWRLPLAQRIPGVSRDVQGTWKGTLASFWVSPKTGKRIPAKTVYLVIRQTATHVFVKLLTNESKSKSSLAQVSEVEKDFILNYLYVNHPEMKVQHRSHMHFGSVLLDVTGCPAKRPKGRYWTDRDTRGELDFRERVTRLADDFEEAKGFFKPAASRLCN